MAKQKRRFFVDDASDKDGATFFVYDKQTGNFVGDSFRDKDEADAAAEKLNGIWPMTRGTPGAKARATLAKALGKVRGSVKNACRNAGKVPKVRAEVHSDDHVVEAEFDAARYLAQATDQDLIALAECGWGGDYPADAVSDFMEDYDSGVERVYAYLQIVDNQGFECNVDEADALAWVQKNRPELYKTLGQKTRAYHFPAKK